MKTFAQKITAVGAGIFLAASVASYGTILYSDNTVDTGNSLSFTNGETLGQQLTINGFNALTLTNFSFELYSTNVAFSGVNMDVTLLTNNGVAYNGYATPGTSFYDSGIFSLQSPVQTLGAGASVETLNFTGLSISMPTNFTLAFNISGLGVNTNIAVELFGTATVGVNNGDYWLNNPNVPGGYELYTNSTPVEFGAQFQGTGTPVPTPEPSVICLGAAGMAALMGAIRLRRKK
jgi:hypothetical protein